MIALHSAGGRLARNVGLVAVGAALAVTSPAPAQFGLAGGIGEAFRPAFTTRDIQLAENILELDEAQRFILETLYEDYNSEFSAGVDDFRDQVADVRNQIDPNNPDPGQIMRIVFGTIDEWRAEARILADQFTMDLQSLLNEEQAARWPAFERKLFRLKYLKNGQLPAEKLDLIVHVTELKLDQAQMEELQPILEEYETLLHEAVKARENYLNTSQSELIAAIQVNNYQLGIDVAQRQVELRKRVRDVNEQYVTTIAAVLPEDAATSFVDRVRQATYPRVYRTTPAERAFSAAKRLDDISDETREAIKLLEQDFTNELEFVNEHLVQVIRNYEPQKIKQKVEMAAARLSGADATQLEDPTRDEFAKRRDLASRYMDLLKALLMPEQFAKLPGARRWMTSEERGAGSIQPAVTPKLFRTPPGNGGVAPIARPSGPAPKGKAKPTDDG